MNYKHQSDLYFRTDEVAFCCFAKISHGAQNMTTHRRTRSRKQYMSKM